MAQRLIPIPKIILYFLILLGMCVILSYGKYFIPDKIPLAPHLATLYGAAWYLHKGKPHVYEVKNLPWLIYYAMRGGYDSVHAPPLTSHPFLIFLAQIFRFPSFISFWGIWTTFLFIAVLDTFRRFRKMTGLTELSIFAFFLFFASPLNKIIWWGKNTFFTFYFLMIFLSTSNPVLRGLSLAFAFLLDPFAVYMVLPIPVVKREWRFFITFCISCVFFHLFPALFLLYYYQRFCSVFYARGSYARGSTEGCQRVFL